MKKTPHALTRLFTLLLASLTILSISVAAAGTAGSSSDPLVTLSYLNEKFLPAGFAVNNKDVFGVEIR